MGEVNTKSVAAPLESPGRRWGTEVSEDQCVGPKLVVVLRPEGRNRLRAVHEAAKKNGLLATEVVLPKESPLNRHGVLVVQGTPTSLQRLAEEYGLQKRLDPGAAVSGHPATAMTDAQARGLDVWRPFARARLAQFAGSAEVESFFSPAEVLQLLLAALCASHPAHGSHSPLLAVQAAGELDSVLALPDVLDLDSLAEVWSPMAIWQPVPGPQIADYFGVSVAQYFILMQAYAWWLMVPTILGLLSFIWNELRTRTEGHATNSLVHSSISPVFVLVVIVWSTVCFSNWRQLTEVSRHNLGQRGLDAPTLGSAWHYFKSQGLTVADGGVEAKADSLEAQRAHFRHVAVVFAMLALLAVSGTMVGALLWVGDWVEARTANIVLQNSPVLLYLVVVGVFESVYNSFAEWLTLLENHVTYTQHVRSLTIKAAFFQLINYLGWFLYLAFWKKDYTLLRAQLLIFFTVKQVIGNVLEFGVPWVKGLWHDKKRLNSGVFLQGEAALQREIEREWLRPAESMCDDYLEVAVLFSAATWFAPVFPLGPLLAFIHAVTEAWGDSYKLCNITRRPVRSEANEVVLHAWLDVFMVISCLGIVISLALFRVEELGWDRTHLDTAEKIVLFVWLYLHLSIPHVPERLAQHMQQVERLLPSQDWLSSAAQKKSS